jgi:hypothetical protein
MMFDLTCFAPDYAAARSRFLGAARAAGATLKSYRNPRSGPLGEELWTDAAWLGPADASKVLVTISATHGVEGFCGSGSQIDWLELRPTLPHDVAVLTIHAINPHGFAWLRRVTEEGVDLNRNHVDFAKPLPTNSGYGELADAIIPKEWTEAALADADKRMQDYARAHGIDALRIAESGGQYTHPDGLFFGGHGPTWSRLTMEKVMADFAIGERRLVCMVDYHTGLGPYGYGEAMIADKPGTLPERRASQWFGESVTNGVTGTTSSHAQFGFVEDGWKAVLGDRVVCLTLEYGCFPWSTTLGSLRQEQWHQLNRPDAGWSDPETVRVKNDIRRAFYPDTDSWRELVLFRSRQILGQALRGMVVSRE